MGNLNENRVDLILGEEVVDRIIDAIDEAISNVPDVALTDEERKAMVSMDVDNKIFAENVLTELDNGADALVPSYVRKENFRKDLTLSSQMLRIASKVALLERRVSDAGSVANSEVMTFSSLTYNLLKAASKAGVSGAKEPADRLAERYKKLGRGDAPENE